MTAPEPFATADLMEQRSLGAITAATHPFLDAELAAASRLIRDYCGWHVAPRDQVRLARRGRYRDEVWLPAIGVESIDSATIDGRDLTADELAALEVDPLTGWTSIEAASVVLTYQAGFEEVPEVIVSTTLQVAARALGSPLGLTREQAGSVSVTHAQVAPGHAGGVVLLPAERDALLPYRIGRLP